MQKIPQPEWKKIPIKFLSDLDLKNNKTELNLGLNMNNEYGTEIRDVLEVL